MSSLRSFLRRRRFPIALKLMLLFVAVILLSVSINIMLARQKVVDDQLALVRASQIVRAQNTASLIDEYLYSLMQGIGVGGALPGIRDFMVRTDDEGARDWARAGLTTLRGLSPSHESVALVDLNGVVVASTRPEEEGLSFRYSPWYMKAAAGEADVSDVTISQASSRPAVFVAAPVRDIWNLPIGVIRARVNLDDLTRRITDDVSVFGDGALGMLVDQHGLRLAFSEARLNRPAEQGGLLLTTFRPLSDGLQQQWATEGRFGPSKTAVVASPQPELAEIIDAGGNARGRTLPGPDGTLELSIGTMRVKPWRYVTTVPTSVVIGPANATAGRLTATGLITAVIAAICAFFFAQSITRPIVRLAHVAGEICLGNTEVEITDDSNDELGDLASAMRRMVGSVRYYMEWATTQETAGDDPFAGYAEDHADGLEEAQAA